MVKKAMAVIWLILSVSLIFSESMVVYAVREGKYKEFEYSIDSDDLVTVTKYTGEESSVTIPSRIDDCQIISIGQGAFEENQTLTSVTLPKSVMKIEERAFKNCQYLQTLTMTDNIMEIGREALLGTAWYDSQPDGEIDIGHCCYTYKGDMSENTDLTVKDGIKGIAEYAFTDCKNLAEIRLPESIVHIGKGAFQNCENLKHIDIPSGITEIDSFTFSGCSAFTKIVIPKNITDIREGAFLNCTDVTELKLSDDLESIGKQAFSGCTGLKALALPSRLKETEEGAFSSCTGLEEIYIPYGFRNIEKEMFRSCGNVKKMIIAESLQKIEASAFADMNIEKIYFGGTEKQWKNISIGVSNEGLLKTNIYYLSREKVKEESEDKNEISTSYIPYVLIALLGVAFLVSCAKIIDLKEKLRKANRKPVRKKSSKSVK